MKGIKDLSAVLILLSLVLLINPASAQQFANDPPLSIPPQIEMEWRNRLDYLKKGEKEKAVAALERIRKIEVELGADNIDLISMALLIEAEGNVSKGDLSSALEDVYAAKEISPGYAPSYYLVSKILFIKGSALEALNSYIDGFIASYKDFWNLFYKIGTLLTIFFLSLISSFVIFLLYLMVRYTPLLEHNIIEWTGATLKGYTIIMIIAILSSLPLLFLWGIIWIPIFWLMIVWIYLTKREKIISIFFLTLLGIAALMSPFFESFFASGESEGLGLMNRVYRGEWISTLSHYESIINEDVDDWKGYFSIAISMKMQGRFDEALQYYEKALTEEAGSAKILNNIGNIYFYKKDYAKAIRFYKAAIEKDSRLVSSHYNMSQALREMLSFEEGNKKYEEARKLNKELTDLYTKKSTLSYQYLVIDEGFSILDLFEKAILLKGAKSKGAILAISTFISGIPVRFLPIFLPFLIFFMAFLSSYLKKKTYLSIYCPVCGSAICRKCYRYIYDMKVCNNCLGLLKKRQGGKKDIKELWIKAKRREKKANILAILMPGTGHMHMDRTIKGYIINLIFFILIWSWFINNAFMKASFSSLLISGSYKIFYYLLLITVIIIYSAFDIYRSREYI